MIKFQSPLFVFGLVVILLAVIGMIFNETCTVITETPPGALSSCERTTLEDDGCLIPRLPYVKCSSIWFGQSITN